MINSQIRNIGRGTVWSQVVVTVYSLFSLGPVKVGHECQDRPQPHGRLATYYEELVPRTTARYRPQRGSFPRFATSVEVEVTVCIPGSTAAKIVLLGIEPASNACGCNSRISRRVQGVMTHLRDHTAVSD